MQLCLSRKRLQVVWCVQHLGEQGQGFITSDLVFSIITAGPGCHWALTQALTAWPAVQLTCWHPDRPYLITECCSIWSTHSGRLESFQRLQVNSSEGQSPQHKAGGGSGPLMTLLTQARLSCQDWDCSEIELCKCSAAESWARGAHLWNNNCGVICLETSKARGKANSHRQGILPYLFTHYSFLEDEVRTQVTLWKTGPTCCGHATLSARLATPTQENRPPNSPKDKYNRTHQTPPHTVKNSNFSLLHSGHAKVGCSRLLNQNHCSLPQLRLQLMVTESC